MIKAVGYLRVSSRGQSGKGHSLEAQAKDMEDFCRENGITLVAHYREVESAAAVTTRPIFKAALKHVYSDPSITFILFTNLDRMARNVIDNELIRQALAKRGKQIISTQQRYLTPMVTGPEDEDLIAALQHAAVDNERERKKIRKRFMRGRKEKIDKGGWVGHRPPYEFDVVQGELVLNKERERTLRHIERIYKLGLYSVKELCDYLNGTNRLFNECGERGRIFPPPGAVRQTLRKRTGGFLKPPRTDWTAPTLWAILDRRRKQASTGLQATG